VCRCSGIVLQNGCQVANWVTDVCGESIIQGISSEISSQPAGCTCLCAVVNIRWFDFNKWGFFFPCNFDWASLPCRLHSPDIPCDEEDR
jgi:hypothetical protein